MSFIFNRKSCRTWTVLDGTIRGYTYRVGQPASMTSGVGTWNPPSSPAIKRVNSIVR